MVTRYDSNQANWNAWAKTIFTIKEMDNDALHLIWVGEFEGYFANRFELVEEARDCCGKKVKELLEPGVKVKVIHNNKNRAGGWASDRDVGKGIHSWYVRKRDAAKRMWGYYYNVWSIIGSEYVYDERSLESLPRKIRMGNGVMPGVVMKLLLKSH